jgi:hypothetical protein
MEMPMMDFLKLRPATNTAASIEEALERAKAAQVEALQRVDTAKLRRDELLLDGEAGPLAAAEKALVTARDDIDRAQAMVTALEARHATAKRSETIGRVDAAGSAYVAADAELRRWWEKNETSLRRILSEGHRLTVALSSSSHELNRQKTIVGQTYPDAEFAEVHVLYGEHRDWPQALARLIEHGVAPPKVAAPAPVEEAMAEVPTVPAGPGSLAMGLHADRDTGALTVRYGTQAAVGEETAA